MRRRGGEVGLKFLQLYVGYVCIIYFAEYLSEFVFELGGYGCAGVEVFCVCGISCMVAHYYEVYVPVGVVSIDVS